MTKKITGTIRKALPADLNLLIDLGKSCFYEAFKEKTAPQDMAAYLNATFRKSNIEKQLNDDRSLIFIAEIDSESAGYVYSHPAASPQGLDDKAALKLERIYLRKRYYGHAIGDALMGTTIEEARSRGYRSVWLSSWELNHRANAFYKKWKFEVVGHQKFVVGSDIQNDFIFDREI
jgi:ribosomal protein S18 acetylase RimI-like enzyme